MPQHQRRPRNLQPQLLMWLLPAVALMPAVAMVPAVGSTLVVPVVPAATRALPPAAATAAATAAAPEAVAAVAPAAAQAAPMAAAQMAPAALAVPVAAAPSSACCWRTRTSSTPRRRWGASVSPSCTASPTRAAPSPRRRSRSCRRHLLEPEGRAASRPWRPLLLLGALVSLLRQVARPTDARTGAAARQGAPIGAGTTAAAPAAPTTTAPTAAAAPAAAGAAAVVATAVRAQARPPFATKLVPTARAGAAARAAGTTTAIVQAPSTVPMARTPRLQQQAQAVKRMTGRGLLQHLLLPQTLRQRPRCTH